MGNVLNKFSVPFREAFFQILLHLVVFVFYSFDKNDPEIKAHQVVFFLSYSAAALIINYVLLPRFYYRKKPLIFFLSVLLVLAGVIVAEELVFEQIYFPDTRGRHFPGVFFSLLDVLPVITILSGFKFAWDAQRKQREVDALKASIQESELQFLKSQINPHFLFNNLNNLYSYAIEQSPKTPAIILELSSVLRYMLYDCRADYVALGKEIAQLENFKKLNELQIEDRGEVRFRTKNIRPGYRIAPLILIVFLENAFKHSTASQSNAIFIEVDIALSDDGLLTFECVNSYNKSQSNVDKLAQGIGLQNVKKRLQLLYPGAHQLEIKADDNRFEVRLTIQLTNDAER